MFHLVSHLVFPCVRFSRVRVHEHTIVVRHCLRRVTLYHAMLY